jgi:hypothetical protein
VSGGGFGGFGDFGYFGDFGGFGGVELNWNRFYALLFSTFATTS